MELSHESNHPEAHEPLSLHFHDGWLVFPFQDYLKRAMTNRNLSEKTTFNSDLWCQVMPSLVLWWLSILIFGTLGDMVTFRIGLGVNVFVYLTIYIFRLRKTWPLPEVAISAGKVKPPSLTSSLLISFFLMAFWAAALVATRSPSAASRSLCCWSSFSGYAAAPWEHTHRSANTWQVSRMG